ncbi:magnesium ion transporter [Savitreella phatthalungensis]
MHGCLARGAPSYASNFIRLALGGGQPSIGGGGLHLRQRLTNNIRPLVRYAHGSTVKERPRPPLERALLERSLLKSASPELLVRCTEFDSTGNVRVVSGEFKKAELCTKHGLLPRDLRKVDTGIHTIIPSILVRKNSILVNLLHIRALVKADLVLVFDVYGSTDSHTQSVFMYDLENRLRQGSKGLGGLPYEFRALEAILVSVVTSLEAELRMLKAMVERLLGALEDNIHRDTLQQLLVHSRKVSNFARRATLIRDHLDELLESDDDLHDMYLTEKGDAHDEVELLLESYLKQTDEIVQTVENLTENIRNTEDIVNIILDAHRNSLMLFEIRVTIATLAIAAGTSIAGLYGMNLPNYLEEARWAFPTVTATAAMLTLVTMVFFRRKLRLMQKLTLTSPRERSRLAQGKKGNKEVASIES